jgi:hypothetical protein
MRGDGIISQGGCLDPGGITTAESAARRKSAEGMEEMASEATTATAEHSPRSTSLLACRIMLMGLAPPVSSVAMRTLRAGKMPEALA